MFLTKSTLKHFCLSIYFTLYFYQEIIDQYGIYYDRNRFRRLYDNLDSRFWSVTVSSSTDTCTRRLHRSATIPSAFPSMPHFTSFSSSTLCVCTFFEE